MVHVSETLAVASESMEGLRKQQEVFTAKQSRSTSVWNSTQDHLQFQTQIIRSLLLRSESNKARLQNEITLVRCSYTFLNGYPDPKNSDSNRLSIQQRNETVKSRLALVKKETAAMKGIAVGTLTFLPATFVSVSALAEISPFECSH